MRSVCWSRPGSGPGVSFWTADGKSIVYEVIEADGDQGFLKLAIDGTGTPEPFLPEAAPQSAADLSPDGGWVAYGSNTSGRVEVYVRAFDGTGSSIRISTLRVVANRSGVATAASCSTSTRRIRSWRWR